MWTTTKSEKNSKSVYFNIWANRNKCNRRRRFSVLFGKLRLGSYKLTHTYQFLNSDKAITADKYCQHIDQKPVIKTISFWSMEKEWFFSPQCSTLRRNQTGKKLPSFGIYNFRSPTQLIRSLANKITLLKTIGHIFALEILQTHSEVEMTFSEFAICRIAVFWCWHRNSTTLLARMSRILWLLFRLINFCWNKLS